MPTTFESFLKKARELADQLDGVAADDDIVMDRIPNMEKRRRESVEAAAYEARKPQNVNELLEKTNLDSVLKLVIEEEKQKNQKNNEYAAETKELSGRGNIKNLINRYETAVASDSINELHPALVKKRLTVAEKKASSNSLLKDLKARKKNKDGGATVNVKKQQQSGANPEGGAQEEEGEDEVNFTSEELLALQMLFLMIDRADDGKIDAQDLVSWSQEGGNFVSQDDAFQCIKALDFDEDGQLGFSDFLMFAGTLKVQYEESQKAQERHLGGLMKLS